MLPYLTINCLVVFTCVQAFDIFPFCDNTYTQNIDKIRILVKDIYKYFIPYKYITLISFHI